MPYSYQLVKCVNNVCQMVADVLNVHMLPVKQEMVY